MTREEEIHKAAEEFAFSDKYDAKWADEHPDSKHTYTKQQLIDMGFAFTTNGDIVTPDQLNEDLKKYLKYRKQKFIERACEWLQLNAIKYIRSIGGCMYFDVINSVNDLKKAMEE